MVEAIRDCEALVAAVARAFYPDDVAIVLDALIRDRYVREDEMGRRLRMSARQARKLLQLLEGERLVDFEVLDVGADGKLKKKKKDLGHEIGKAGDAGRKSPAPPAANEIYWYVDLARFVDVIRWRVHTMRETIRKRESAATAALTFRCGRCGVGQSSLDAVRYQFKCPERLCLGEPDALLTESALDASLTSARRLGAKVDAQLGSSEDHDRAGIYELLRRLDGKELPSNKPSENRARGVGGWLGNRGDDKKYTRNEDGTITTTFGSKHDRSGLASALFARNDRGQTVSVSLNGETTTSTDQPKKEAKKDSSLPSFLQGSRVQPRTAQDMLQDESDEEMEDAEGLVATQAARQASESWKPVDRGGAVHLGARGGWAAVTSPREVVEEVVEEEEEVVVESDDDAGVAWTPYTKDDSRLGYVFVPSSNVS